MAATLSDQAFLGSDGAFQNRVRQSLIAACISIMNEGFATPQVHMQRARQCVSILNSLTTYVPLYTMAVATDASVIADATQAGTVALTTGNAPTQGALVTDAHISNAISGQFNAFFMPL